MNDIYLIKKVFGFNRKRIDIGISILKYLEPLVYILINQFTKDADRITFYLLTKIDIDDLDDALKNNSLIDIIQKNLGDYIIEKVLFYYNKFLLIDD